MEHRTRIDLAGAGERRLGPLLMRPQLRALVREDGSEEVIEPRVMQVLVALAEAEGGVVSRDALIARCWDGRVVGEDAINRVISRLRRSVQRAGGGLRIETVNKVGYRLIVEDARTRSARDFRLGRRALLIAGATLGAGGGIAALWLGRGQHAAPAAADPFIAQGLAALREGGIGSNNRAIANLRHVTDLAPGYADGWGLLACAYAAAFASRPSQSRAAIQAQMRDAIARAEKLDSGNGLARAAAAMVLPRPGNERTIEQALRAGIAGHPDNDLLLTALATLMLGVGRCHEAATLLDRALVSAPPGPGTLYIRVQALWAAGRRADADRAIDEAYALYPIDLAVWFTRFYFYLYTGRAAAAVAQGMNRAGRPRGLPDYNFDVVIAAARAMISGRAADIDAAVAANLEAAHQGAGYAENAMQIAAAFGRLDTAFAIADAYYFARGFSTGELRFRGNLGSYTPQNDRRTCYLFMPSTRAMRGDSRFARLTAELGLTRYWAQAGVQPDDPAAR